jgi:type IX secretion system PorP/SprF family membrane protein
MLFLLKICFVPNKNTIFERNKKPKSLKKLSIFLSAALFTLALCTQTLVAQDIHFSQYYASPMSLNPAETGFFAGNWRFTNNYRTQWSAIGIPFNTVSAGFDKPFKLKKSVFGLGVFFVNDKSGSSELTVNKLFISGNFIKTFNEIHTFGFGLQIGYVVKTFALNGLTVPSQFNTETGIYDIELPNNIDAWDENINYADINLGVNYSGKFGKMTPQGGIALFHINNPKESFLRTDNKLPMRLVFNASLEIPIKENIYIKPNLLTMYHKKAGDWVIGALGYYILPTGSLINKAFGGLHTRTSLSNFDALIFTGGVNVYGFDVGLSYDVNISKLRTATNSRGAFEISIIYKDITQTLTKIALPCDRY